MKKLFILLCLIGIAVASGHAQTDYRQWETGYMKVKSGETDAFEKAVAAHNKKYHAAAPYRVGVWKVLTGPYSGQYFIALGSMTFTDIEGRPNSPEHNMDWKMNVLPHVETDGETIYWRQDKDATYSAPNSDHFKYSRLRYFTLIPGERDRFEDQVKKVAAMYKGKAYPASYNVYWRFGASTGPHVCTEINMEHWSYFDRPDTFEKDFEEVNGEGSYERFMEEYKLCIDRTKTYDELIEFQPDLSSF